MKRRRRRRRRRFAVGRNEHLIDVLVEPVRLKRERENHERDGKRDKSDAQIAVVLGRVASGGETRSSARVINERRSGRNRRSELTRPPQARSNAVSRRELIICRAVWH